MIRFRYQPTFEDWRAFNRIVLQQQLRFFKVLALAIFILSLIYPLALRSMGRNEEGLLVAYRKNPAVWVIPGLAALVWGATYIGVRKRWKAAEELREAREYEIDQSGVRVTGASLSGCLEWRYFTRAERKDGYFLLKTGQNQFHYFPESAVSDKEALNALLAAKVPSKKG